MTYLRTPQQVVNKFLKLDKKRQKLGNSDCEKLEKFRIYAQQEALAWVMKERSALGNIK